MDRQEQYSVAVAGHMNPAIHHPMWYRAVGLLPNDVDAPSEVLVTPQLAKFVVGSLTVQCLPDRWHCQVASRTELAQAVNIARGVFDKLGDTPVQSFGTNYSLTGPVGPEAGQRLSASVTDAPFVGRMNGAAPRFETATVSYALPDLEVPDGLPVSRQFRVTTLVGNPDRTVMQVSVNVHHRIRVTGVRHFELGPMLTAAEPAYVMAEKHVAEIFAQAERGD